MAAGDTISSSASVNAGTYIYLTPASGDEWMIMQIGTSSTGTYMQMTPNSSTFYTMYASPSYAGNYTSLYTGVSQYMTTNNMISRPDLHWHISPVKRIRAYSSGYNNFWWAGIKTKD